MAVVNRRTHFATRWNISSVFTGQWPLRMRASDLLCFVLLSQINILKCLSVELRRGSGPFEGIRDLYKLINSVGIHPLSRSGRVTREPVKIMGFVLSSSWKPLNLQAPFCFFLPEVLSPRSFFSLPSTISIDRTNTRHIVSFQIIIHTSLSSHIHIMSEAPTYDWTFGDFNHPHDGMEVDQPDNSTGNKTATARRATALRKQLFNTYREKGTERSTLVAMASLVGDSDPHKRKQAEPLVSACNLLREPFLSASAQVKGLQLRLNTVTSEIVESTGLVADTSAVSFNVSQLQNSEASSVLKWIPRNETREKAILRSRTSGADFALKTFPHLTKEAEDGIVELLRSDWEKLSTVDPRFTQGSLAMSSYHHGDWGCASRATVVPGTSSKPEPALSYTVSIVRTQESNQASVEGDHSV